MKKNLILKSLFFLMTILVTAGIVFMSSCSKDNSTPPIVKTALTDSITTANALFANSVEGVVAGDYQKGSKAILKTAIDGAQAILDNPASTQANIDAAVVNLHNAMNTFRNSVIVPIAQENLIAQWTFNEGTGTTVSDATSNHLNGTFKEGYSTIDGHGPLPEWTTDRYGVENQALHFSKGGHIEIPYNTVLFPTEISISFWAKVDNIFSDNYMMSQNWWEGWKIQYQSANKVFFTYKNASANYYDRDWSVNGQDTTSWHHVVVTLKAGEEDFYADGALVKSWTDVTGGLNAPPNPVAFCIGQEFPNDRPGIAAADDPAQYAAGYYKGSLDDIRIYNTALTATQVTGIYDLEKP